MSAGAASRSASWKPGSGRTIPMFVSAGLGEHARDVAVGQRRLEGRRRRSTRPPAWWPQAATGGPTFPSRATTAPPSSVANVSSTRAVVAPVEDEDLRSPGELARQADREPVRVGRRQRELPAREPEAARQLLADPERVLAREHQRDPAGGLLGDRARRWAPASGRSSRPCRRGRSRRTRGRRRRGTGRRAPPRRRRGSRRPIAPSTASARRRAASRAPGRRAPSTADARARSARARVGGGSGAPSPWKSQSHRSAGVRP